MTFPAVARKKIREGVERGSALILGRAGAPAFAWASAVAEAMADKPARQGWRRGRLWRDTEPAVTGVPRVKFFSSAIWCDLVLLGGEEFKVQGSKFKVQSSRFKVQGSKFKVQGAARKWKKQKLPVWAAIRPDQALLEACFHCDWV
jgi:hypothetical protein